MKSNFELYCDKWETHNSAIETDTFTMTDLPTVRIKTGSHEYKLGLTLHKWKMVPSGQALAILTFGPNIHEDSDFWNNPKDSTAFQNAESVSDLIEKVKEQPLEQVVSDIENGKTSIPNLVFYKYHASQWREVEKPKSKWVYKEKAEKSEYCNVQRLLNT